MNLAPIALFVYNRPIHTKRVIAALQNNEYSKDSELFIYADGAKVEGHAAGVVEVRHYLRTIGGFKSVHIIEREKNYGCAKSIVSGITEVVNTFGRVIVVEDDILTSRYFLKYMNEALSLYQDDERVACIHGYLYPTAAQLPETFFIKGADIWGWATWKRAWDLYEFDAEKLLNELNVRNLTKAFNFGGSYDFTRMLKEQRDGKLDTWDIQWYASSFLQDKLCLYPGRSLVQNIGLDCSGTHCIATDLYAVEISQIPIRLERIPLEEDSGARKAIGSFHKLSKVSLLKKIYRRLLKSLSGQ